MMPFPPVAAMTIAMILSTSSFSLVCPGARGDQSSRASGIVLRFPGWQATAMHPW